MPELDYPTASAGELARALAAKQLSAVELFDAAVARIEAMDGRINAVVVRDFDRARDAAKAADAALARGERAPLLGVPMTVKEAFDVAGLPTTWGIRAFREVVPKTDAVAVQRLKAAGAVILGKTNVPPNLGDWQTDNPIHGRTNNPHDLARTPGGSSGGSAAALAAGYAPLEFGSDIGGSIRVPSSFCGVFGHKPTHELVPQRGHQPGGQEGAPVPLGVVGPMARSAADLALALEITAGPDVAEAVGYRLALPAPRHDKLSDYRVLVMDDHPLCATDGEIRGALERLARQLEKRGATVARGEPLVPDLAAAQPAYISLVTSVVSLGAPGAASPRTAHEYLAALNAQFETRRRWAALFRDWDVLIAPCYGSAAFPHKGGDQNDRTLTIDGTEQPYMSQIAWPAMATLPNLPATAVPVARTASGLPIGVQVVGPHLEDRMTIHVAGLLEAV